MYKNNQLFMSRWWHIMSWNKFHKPHPKCCLLLHSHITYVVIYQTKSNKAPENLRRKSVEYFSSSDSLTRFLYFLEILNLLCISFLFISYIFFFHLSAPSSLPFLAFIFMTAIILLSSPTTALLPYHIVPPT